MKVAPELIVNFICVRLTDSSITNGLSAAALVYVYAWEGAS